MDYYLAPAPVGGAYFLTALSPPVVDPGDTTDPVFAGPLSVLATTTTTATLGWAAATDVVGVVGYRVSKDGGATYATLGNVLSVTLNLLTPDTAYPCKVLAFDLAGNESAPLSVSATTAAVPIVVDPPVDPTDPPIVAPNEPPFALNLAWLKAEIAKWMHRDDLASSVPTFILMAESAINRKLGIAPKEVEIPMVMTVGSRFVARPVDMGQPIALWLEADQPRTKLIATLPSAMQTDSGMTGRPMYWAIDGMNIALNKRADQAYPLSFRFVQDNFLTDANPTNDLLRRAPDLYLYGALAQAAPYMRDDERIGFWKTEFARLLKDVHAEYSRTKAVANLRTEVPRSFLCN